MVVTVEPGCYFSAALLEPALKVSKLRRNALLPASCMHTAHVCVVDLHLLKA